MAFGRVSMGMYHRHVTTQNLAFRVSTMSMVLTRIVDMNVSDETPGLEKNLSRKNLISVSRCRERRRLRRSLLLQHGIGDRNTRRVRLRLSLRLLHDVEDRNARHMRVRLLLRLL